MGTSSLAAYRELLRAMRIVFRGDHALLSAARHSARQGFDLNKDLDTDSAEADAGVKHARDVAKILRTNVVQGVRIDEEAPVDDVDGKSGTYKLNIHDQTERGDNESIRLNGKTRAQPTNLAGGCGSTKG